MAEAIIDTPTASKMLTIICNRLHRKRDSIIVGTTFKDLGITEAQKETIIREVSDAFLIPTEGRLLNMIKPEGGGYIKDSFTGHLKRINDLLNLLQFIEGNDDKRGKPAAYNI
jgi:hypothetical protein